MGASALGLSLRTNRGEVKGGHLASLRQSQGGNHGPAQLSQRLGLVLPSAVGFLNSLLALGFPIPIALVLGVLESHTAFQRPCVSLAPSGQSELENGEPARRHASADDDNREHDNNDFLWDFPSWAARSAQSIPDCPGGGAGFGTCPTRHPVGSRQAWK